MNYHLSHTVTIPIQCQHTMEAIGSCRVTLNPLHAPASGATTPGTVSLPMTNQLVPGTKLSFSIVIDTVKGLSAEDFASVHAQTRLSSLVGSDIAADDIFASLPVDLDKSSVAHLSLRRNVSVIVTPDLISHLETGHGTIEFFAKVRPEYLDRLERFDRNREVLAAGSGSSTPSRADKGDSRPMMRRCETDFIASEHHNILASVCIKELASDGAYEPAEVFDNIVHLHQGVQRQIHLTLSHSSGKALPWVKVSHFSSGDIRVKTNTGIIGASRPDVELRGVLQEVTFDTDGTSRLDIYGVWDTASHHCIHLDRKTASESKVLVKLTWLVEVSSLDEPAVFHLDLPIRILNRDTRRSSLMALFTAPKIFKAYTAVFSVDLGPPLASTAGDLWRLDTGKKHVIGEEILGDWKPRSVSLLQDWERLRRTDRTLAEVQLTKVVLNLVGDGSQKVMSEERRAEVIKLCVASWMKALEHRVKVGVELRYLGRYLPAGRSRETKRGRGESLEETEDCGAGPRAETRADSQAREQSVS
jgi:kinesin family protein 1